MRQVKNKTIWTIRDKVARKIIGLVSSQIQDTINFKTDWPIIGSVFDETKPILRQIKAQMKIV